MTSATGRGTSRAAWGFHGWGGGPAGFARAKPWTGSSGFEEGGWHHPVWRLPVWHRGGVNPPLAVLLTVLGFLFWWPAGLAILFFMVGTGRMGRVRRQPPQAAYQPQDGEDGAEASWNLWNPAPPSGGNQAFDEYRADTLRRMEEEQQEFAAFVERLRFARDKAEFDQFMAERRARFTSSGDQPTP